MTRSADKTTAKLTLAVMAVGAMTIGWGIADNNRGWDKLRLDRQALRAKQAATAVLRTKTTKANVEFGAEHTDESTQQIEVKELMQFFVLQSRMKNTDFMMSARRSFNSRKDAEQYIERIHKKWEPFIVIRLEQLSPADASAMAANEDFNYGPSTSTAARCSSSECNSAPDSTPDSSPPGWEKR